MTDAQKNADRFTGFADLYDNARPALPEYPVRVITRYLGKIPSLVIDLGCGTGLSTLAWQGKCARAIGIDPSDDMLSIARRRQSATLSFQKGFGHATGLESAGADVVVCSQSFHWMEPGATLAEVNRILAPGGVFATVDCDWPFISEWNVDRGYEELFSKVCEIEANDASLRDGFVRYSKEKHLANIKQSGYFRYAREVVFSNTEKCTTERLMKLALSQGGLQAILKTNPELITHAVARFSEQVSSTFGSAAFDIDFSYRMRIGIK